MTEFGQLTGRNGLKVDPNAPGSSVDVGQSNDDRAKTLALIQQLQQQAQNGNPQAIAQLKQATAGANAQAQAIGQAGSQQHGQSNLSAGSGIINAVAGNNQRAAGEANQLNAQSELQAQDELSQIQGGLTSQDLSQAQAQQQAAQGVREANTALEQKQSGAFKGFLSGIGSMATMGAGSGGGGGGSAGMSSGGDVPGAAQFGGDDPRNDTVKALLSPGEYVIDRESMKQPWIRDFVNAVKASKGEAQHLDSGGYAGTGITPNGGGFDLLSGPGPQVGTTQNGGVLDLAQYNQDRQNQEQLAGMLQQRAAGNGPSMVGQQLQNASDANIANALLNQGRGGNARAVQGGAAQGQMQAVGRSGEQKLGEVGGGQRALGSLLGGMRGQDIGAAQAQQKAQFANTLMNANLSLDQQAAIRGMVGGAGQAASAAAGSGLLSGGPEAPDQANLDSLATNQAASDPGEWNSYGQTYGSSGSSSIGPQFSFGGEVPKLDKKRASAFVDAVHRHYSRTGTGRRMSPEP